MGIQVLFLLLAILFISVLGSEDLTLETFTDTVARDERVTAVEYYSNMCGSCKEFAPQWRILEVAMKSVVAAKVNIDTPEGMELARSQKVLEEGIPNIRLYTKKSDSVQSLESISILNGDVIPARQVLNIIKKHVNGLPRRDDGFYLKK